MAKKAASAKKTAAKKASASASAKSKPVAKTKAKVATPAVKPSVMAASKPTKEAKPEVKAPVKATAKAAPVAEKAAAPAPKALSKAPAAAKVAAKPVQPVETTEKIKIDRDRMTDEQIKWAEMYNKYRDAQASAYDMKGTFKAGAPILHKVLGWGWVVSNENDRLEVLFKDGKRMLISNYRG